MISLENMFTLIHVSYFRVILFFLFFIGTLVTKAMTSVRKKSVVESATCRLVQKQCAGMQPVFNSLVRQSRCGDSRSTVFIMCERIIEKWFGLRHGSF
jgi:hypothetical protein